MSGQSSNSSSYGDTLGTDTSSSATTNTTSSVNCWAPHGRALTTCLIVGSLALVGLIYLYFWRLFSRKRSAAGDDDEDAPSSSTASPLAPSPPRSPDQQKRAHDRLVASLPPTFVVRAGASDEKGKGPSAAVGECAVCIAELRDGDEARALPQCGHGFHAACVDAWLRRHTTCPLFRASVSAAAGPRAGGGVMDTTTALAVEDMDAPPV